MMRITKIDLSPAINFNPFYFDINEPFPVGLTAEQRHAHWKKLMQTTNFDDLVPIEKGLELVRTDHLSKSSLIELLKIQFPLLPCNLDENEVDEDDEDTYDTLEGGVVMTGNDQVIFIPQCCTGFSDYQEWLDIKKTDHYHRTYIGHPWIYTHAKGDDLIFSGLIDNNLDSGNWEYRALDDMPRGWGWGGSLKDLDQNGIKNLMCQYVVSYELFEQAQVELEKKVDLFYKRVLTELQNLGFNKATARVDCFVKGINGFPSYDKERALPVLPFEL